MDSESVKKALDEIMNGAKKQKEIHETQRRKECEEALKNLKKWYQTNPYVQPGLTKTVCPKCLKILSGEKSLNLHVKYCNILRVKGEYSPEKTLSQMNIKKEEKSHLLKFCNLFAKTEKYDLEIELNNK